MKNNPKNKISAMKLAITITAVTYIAAVTLSAVMSERNDIKRVFIQTVADDDAAFILEAQWMNEYAEDGIHLLNKIASPGFTKGTDMYDKLAESLFKNWIKNLQKRRNHGTD